MSVTKEQINLALSTNNIRLRVWADENQYPYETVRTVIRRWAGRTDRSPLGGIARQIMKDLNDYVNRTSINTSDDRFSTFEKS